jgi:V/A-type H+-transporting ATPase subunit C
MSGYDYGNARLRAMKSRLLSRRELEALAGVGSLRGLIAALTKTTYRKPVEAAMVHASGIDCIAEALRQDLIDTFGRIREFYIGHERDLVDIVLRIYDVHNLKTILRGLSQNAPSGEIITSLLPVGELSYSTLAELTRAPNPRAAIDLLASMRLPIAQPLLKLRAERPGADTPETELALEHWYFQRARQHLQRSPLGAGHLIAFLELEADLTNLLTVLRFAHAPAERRVLPRWLGADGFRRLFIDPGRLSFELLTSAGDQETPEAAVEALAGTPYEPLLRAGLEAYAQSGRLSDFEKYLRHFRLRWMAGLIAKDPLGIGVLLGYLALKTSEVSNLRWLAQGIRLGLKTEEIRRDLEFVS